MYIFIFYAYIIYIYNIIYETKSISYIYGLIILYNIRIRIYKVIEIMFVLSSPIHIPIIYGFHLYTKNHSCSSDIVQTKPSVCCMKILL